MRLTKEDILHLGNLCNLQLSDDEVSKFRDMFSDTLEYVALLEKLDTTNDAPTYQVTNLSDVFMNDGENSATLSREKALSSASECVDNKIATKAVFDR